MEVVDRPESMRVASEARFAELEALIERGLVTFIEVGRALIEIREFKLYLLAGFPTFPAYTQRRWGLSRGAAYKTVYAVRVVDALGGENLPANQTQALALTPLLKHPEKLREAWDQARAAGGDEGVTAKDVRAAVNAQLGRIDRRTRQGRPPRMATCPQCGHEFAL